jgi:hypothetical protein
VKGGVGKSTLSVLTACALAQRNQAPVTLIDMDLTGTSLADVLPLRAPLWPDAGPSDVLNLLNPPSGGFHSLEETRTRIEARGEAALEAEEDSAQEATEASTSVSDGEEAVEAKAEEGEDEGGEDEGVPPANQSRGVPVLNDYLLFATPDWDEQQDIPIQSLLWSVDGIDFERLQVIPSSALPADLNRILPVIFDENHSGFLEGRLEYLLNALVPDEGERIVIVDTPPTIPGLSRSVLSLALRLSDDPQRPLSSEDPFIPERLRDAVDWTAFVVSTMDQQDLVAASRWISLIKPGEQTRIRFLVNRSRGADQQQLRALFEKRLSEAEPNVLLNDPEWIEEQSGMSIFRATVVPRPVKSIEDLLNKYLPPDVELPIA